MTITKRAVALILPVLVAGAATVLATGEADAATALRCTTTTGNTGGTATCTGSGVWRIHLDCVAGPDEVGPWIHQSGGTVRAIASRTCVFKNRQTTVERP